MGSWEKWMKLYVQRLRDTVSTVFAWSTIS